MHLSDTDPRDGPEGERQNLHYSSKNEDERACNRHASPEEVPCKELDLLPELCLDINLTHKDPFESGLWRGAQERKRENRNWHEAHPEQVSFAHYRREEQNRRRQVEYRECALRKRHKPKDLADIQAVEASLADKLHQGHVSVTVQPKRARDGVEMSGDGRRRRFCTPHRFGQWLGSRPVDYKLGSRYWVQCQAFVTLQWVKRNAHVALCESVSSKRVEGRSDAAHAFAVLLHDGDHLRG
jgi:hypothetical protein